MTGLRDVLHFSFTVEDLEASIEWYTEVLGLELVHRQRQENAYTQQLVGIEGAVLEVAQFRVPGVSPGLSTHMLELVQYLQMGLDPPSGLPTNQPGVAHLALLVTDIHDRYERMKKLDVAFRNPPTEITEGANAGGWACYFHDPEGITLELLQPPAERIASWG
jgi:catechol 2,3-dioxygenase-like lactoylglutathione lyase family enzyme